MSRRRYDFFVVLLSPHQSLDRSQNQDDVFVFPQTEMKKRKLINLNWTPRVLSSPKKGKEEEKRGGKDFFSIYAFLPSILRNQNEHEKKLYNNIEKKEQLPYCNKR